jgi:photosystem II stability/assembly factor-like uncharacterized protein
MRLRALIPLLVAAAVVVPAVPAEAHHALPSWQLVPTGSASQFRGLAAVDRHVAWVAGAKGAVLRTSDGGQHWLDVSPAGASALEFRDIEAWDSSHAVALTIGTGTDSSVYRTSDGGATWQQTFVNDDPNAFYDCMAFFSPRDGLAVSDPVGGRFRLIATHDGGRSWAVVDPAGMPPALDGEFGFAASGTCLVTSGHDAWIASGGGRSWTVASTPMVTGPSAGIYSLAVSGHRHVVGVGGDFEAPTANVDVAASSRDAGGSWTLAATMPGGYRSGVAFAGHSSLVAVGPTGSDVSFDGGRDWTTFDTVSYDAVQAGRDGAVWASGTGGRVAVLAR